MNPLKMTTMRNKTMLLLGCFVFAAIAVSANDQWTLRHCIDYALEHNITVRQYDNTRRSNEIDLNTSQHNRLPNVSAGANQSFSFGRSLNSDNSYVSRNTANSSADISVSVPVFSGFRLPKETENYRLNLQASLQDLNKAKEDISLQVTSAYLQAIYDKEALNVANEQISLSGEQLSRLERMVTAGKAAESELYEVRSQVAQDKMSAVKAENSFRLSLLDLSQLLELSTPDSFDVVVPQDISVTLPPSNPDQIFRQALALKPAVRAQQLRVEAARTAIDIARSAYYPSLNFSAGMGTSYYKTSGYDAASFSSQIKDNFSKSLGFSLSIPIFNGFQTRNSIRKAKIAVENQQLELENVRKTLYKEIQQAYYNAVNSNASFISSKEAETAASESFDMVRKKYENGKANATEYNEAKTKLQQAEITRLQSQVQLLFNKKILSFYAGEELK
jgi:outer membrane protein